MSTRGKALTFWGTVLGVIVSGLSIASAFHATGGIATKNELIHTEKMILESVDQTYARKESVQPHLQRIEEKVDKLLLTRWSTK